MHRAASFCYCVAMVHSKSKNIREDKKTKIQRYSLVLQPVITYTYIKLIIKQETFGGVIIQCDVTNEFDQITVLCSCYCLSKMTKTQKTTYSKNN